MGFGRPLKAGGPARVDCFNDYLAGCLRHGVPEGTVDAVEHICLVSNVQDVHWVWLLSWLQNSSTWLAGSLSGACQVIQNAWDERAEVHMLHRCPLALAAKHAQVR